MHSFTPPTSSFHTAGPEKSFTSPKSGKWGSLHVCIAWQIYHKEQLKKVKLKSKCPHQDPIPKKDPSIQCNLDTQSAETVYTNISNKTGGKPVKNELHFNSYFSHLHHFSLHHHTSKRDKQPPKHPCNYKSQNDDKKLACDSKAKSLTHSSSHILRSHDRKRRSEDPNVCKGKRVKQEVEDEFGVSAKTNFWSHTIPDVNTVFYSNSGRCTTMCGSNPPWPFHSHISEDMHQHQTSAMDRCIKVRVPFKNESLIESSGFTPFYCPPAFTQDFKQKWFQQATQQNCNVQHLWMPPASTWAYDNCLSRAKHTLM